jgi:hypothetical protein
MHLVKRWSSPDQKTHQTELEHAAVKRAEHGPNAGQSSSNTHLAKRW